MKAVGIYCMACPKITEITTSMILKSIPPFLMYTTRTATIKRKVSQGEQSRRVEDNNRMCYGLNAPEVNLALFPVGRTHFTTSVQTLQRLFFEHTDNADCTSLLCR